MEMGLASFCERLGFLKTYMLFTENFMKFSSEMTEAQH